VSSVRRRHRRHHARSGRCRCITDVSVRGAPGCVGLSVLCRSVLPSLQLGRYIPAQIRTDRHVPVPPFFRFGSRRPGVRISPPRPHLAACAERGSRQATSASSPTPHTTKAAPSTRVSASLGTSFSRSTTAATSAIHQRFITPSTNNRVMSAQQHPMHNVP
jgi:hypothetical protein